MPHTTEPVADHPPRAVVTPLRIILFLICLLILWAAYFLLGVMYAPVKITTDYGAKAHGHVRARQSMPAGAPDNWDLFARMGEKFDAARRAVEARNPNIPIDAYDPSYLFRPDIDPYNKDYTREDAVRVCTEWLEEFRRLGGLDDLKQFPSIPYAARPSQEGPVIGFVMADLGKARLATRMNCARMFLASRAGDDADRLAAFEETLAMGRLISAQFSLIESLVGTAVHAAAQNELRTEIVEGTVPPEAAAALLAAMDRRPLWPLSATLDSERFFTLDFIQRTFSDTGSGNGRFLPTEAAKLGGFSLSGNGSRMGEYRVFNLLGLLHPDRKSTEAKANAIFDQMAKLASMPRAERASSGITIDDDAELKGYKVLEMLLPAIGRSLQSRDQIDSDREATRLMLALEVYRGRHGTYPGTLAALAPEILPAIPLDAVTGMSFGYEVLDPAADEHGRGYLLYSFASDGVDNRGFMSDKPPVTPFLPAWQTGVDFVYNQPRPKPKPPEPEPVPNPDEPQYEIGIETPAGPSKSEEN